MLLVRESRTGGVTRRTFEVVSVATLAVEREHRRWAAIGAARRWVPARWRDSALALR